MNNALEHHGILGMKWGVIRTPEQLGHPTASASKSAMTGKNEADSDTPKEKKSWFRSASKAGKANKIVTLTDEELRARVNRLSMEKQYKDLVASLNPKRKSVVSELIGDAAKNLGKQTLTNAVNAFVGKYLKFDGSSETKYTIESLNKIDFLKADPELLKRAAAAYTNFSKITESQNKK